MDLRSIFLLGILGLPAVGVLNALYFGTELKAFVRTTPRLESSHDLERFKTVVAHQMYAALTQIALLTTPTVLYFVGLFREILKPSDVLFVIGPSAVILIVAAVYRSWEKQAKNIPAADPEIEAQRDAIVRTWMRRPWPDW